MAIGGPLPWRSPEMMGRFAILILIVTACARPAYQSAVRNDGDYYVADGRQIGIRVADSSVIVGFLPGDISADSQLRLVNAAGQRLSLADASGAVLGPTVNRFRLRDPLLADSIAVALEQIGAKDVVRTLGYFVDSDVGERMILTDEIILRFRRGVAESAIGTLVDSLHLGRLAGRDSGFPWRVYRVLSGNPREALLAANQLAKDKAVDFAHPNFMIRVKTPDAASGDSLTASLIREPRWFLRSFYPSHGSSAWRPPRGSPNTTIAVLDFMFQIDHPALVRAFDLTRGRNFVDSPATADLRLPRSPVPHGTNVAGLAAGYYHGVFEGACPLCRLIPIRIPTNEFDAIDRLAGGLHYAFTIGADVINNSWSASPQAMTIQPIREAIANAVTRGRGGHGAVVIFSGGGLTPGQCLTGSSAAGHPDVLTVAGVNSLNERISGASGDCLDVLGPSWSRNQNRGIPIRTTSLYSSYDAFGGASAAAPIVAGAVGVLLSLSPGLTGAQAVNLVRASADKIEPHIAGYDESGRSSTHGYGALNAYRLLVPSVRILPSRHRVRVGEPVSLSVTASAPFGLAEFGWFVAEPPANGRRVRGRDVTGHFISRNVKFPEAGVYTIVGFARSRAGRQPAGYPLTAGAAGTADTILIRVDPI